MRRFTLPLLLLSFTAALRAEGMGDTGQWFLPFIMPVKLGGGLDGTVSRNAPASDGADLGWKIAGANLYTQPWHDDTNELRLGLSARTLNLSRRPILFERGALPDHYWDLAANGMFRHVSASGLIAGGSLGVGATSDRPFKSGGRAGTFNASGFVRLPATERSAWLLFIVFNTDNRSRGLNLPVPGFAWQYATGRDLNVLIGVPFSFVMWRPQRWLETNALVTPFGQLGAGIGVSPFTRKPWLSFTADYALLTQTWRRADRPSERDRLFLREQHVLAGVAAKFGPVLKATLAGGWAWDRQLREGRSYDNDTARDNAVRLAAAPVLSASIAGRF